MQIVPVLCGVGWCATTPPAFGWTNEETMDAALAEQVRVILAEVTRWAAERGDICAVALVGSWARGAARPDSDIDLVLLTPDPLRFRRDYGWITEIDWVRIGASVAYWGDADYGPVWSRHLHLTDNTEIELGFSPPSWASVDPLDAGTRQVIRDGCRILYDPLGLLDQLVRHT
jgi:hypothetical protein